MWVIYGTEVPADDVHAEGEQAVSEKISVVMEGVDTDLEMHDDVAYSFEVDVNHGFDDDENVTDAIALVAEMSLLGIGHAGQMYPEESDLFAADLAFSEEQEWRVAL